MAHPLALPNSWKWIHTPIKKILCLDKLETIYDSFRKQTKIVQTKNNNALLDYALKFLNIDSDWQYQERFNEIPSSGALIIVANHPLGGLEGMLIAQTMLKIRPDLKVLTNKLLLRFPEFENLFVGVDVLNQSAQQKNRGGLLTITRHLKQGGALLIFPAGTVAHQSLTQKELIEQPWNRIVGNLMMKYQCPCQPIFVEDKNSRGFYLSHYIHKRLRTALLGRAMISKQNQNIKMHLGQLIEAKEIKSIDCPTKLTEYIKTCCELLTIENKPSVKLPLNHKSIRADIKEHLLLKKLQQLQSYELFSSHQFRVICAPYDALGCVMEQIAISRERTFRAVDEGTGKELDNDCFDPFYWHLFIWDNEKNKLVGGYRLGKVDEIIAQHGIENLYSQSMYHYENKFIQSLAGSVEVGRSFVTEEYQRHSKVLDLLWKGIGRFMAKNPKYHTLFGCVSISKSYSKLAQAFLADSLLKHFNAKTDVISQVQPKLPLDVKNKPWDENLIKMFSSLPIINKLLGRIDSGKTIPILIRHYLALNGKFASFCVNQSFNDSLDGLIIVDLRITPEKYLRRYLGEEGAEKFTKKWGEYEAVA